MMKHILKTKYLESPSSTFLIDLIKHPSGKEYLEITQTIQKPNFQTQHIKINPDILPELINILQELSNNSRVKPKKIKRWIWKEEIQQKIAKSYLIGVSSKDLAMQYGTKPDTIEKILINKNITLASNKPPKRFWRLKGKK
ncbi:hypothetical protein [Salegentibacter salarius]|nr:hypothetical protein [Salegentibacter salarius]